MGYLFHLYRMRDPSYMRLATKHNLRFMTQLIERLRHPNA
jgi:tRNA-guanine family transglycosylase